MSDTNAWDALVSIVFILAVLVMVVGWPWKNKGD